MLKKITIIITGIICLLGTSIAWAAPQNIIVLIGDGMGFEQVRAAGMYMHGTEGGLVFESFPHQAQVTTYAANDPITNSAAAGTAIATGTKVNLDVISMEIPGDGSELYTMLEYFADQNKSTGLVTTTHMTNATPAAFGAHENSRYNYSAIASDLLNQTIPINVLFGGGGIGLTESAALAAGYTVVSDYAEMQQDWNTNGVTMVSGHFGVDNMPYEYDYLTGADTRYDTLPHLSEMASTALDILDNDPDGFFLMIEGGRIDHAGHENRIDKNIYETIEFNATVQTVMNWAAGRTDTLVIVTADHESGGLQILQNNGQDNFPLVQWSTFGHSSANVPVYAWGDNADMVSGVMDNTEFFDIIVGEISSTSFYTALASWEANVTDIEVFTTTANNIAQSNEVASLPGLNEQLGPALFFETANTGLSKGFVVETLEMNAGFSFSDTESGVPVEGYENALSVGDVNNYEDDDWQLDLLDGAVMTAFGIEIRHTNFVSGETIKLYSNGTLVSTIDLSTLPATGNGTYFVGATSTVPFDSIIFNEDPDGDDIAIADFRFATEASVDLPQITSPAPGTTLSSATETFTWTSGLASVSQWWLWVGSSLGEDDILNSGNLGSSTSLTVSGLPTDGSTLYVRLWYYSGSWQSDDFQFTTYVGGGVPAITSPAPGSSLSSSIETFTWTAGATSVSEWWLWMGTSIGGNDVLNSGSLGSSTSLTIRGLPTDGSTLYVRLWYYSGSWQSDDFQFTTYDVSAAPAITSPVPGTTLSNAIETFTWTAGEASVSEWWIWVGTCSSDAWGGCGDDIYNSGSLGNSTSLSISGLPQDDSTVYVRLYYKENNIWKSVIHSYTSGR